MIGKSVKKTVQKSQRVYLLAPSAVTDDCRGRRGSKNRQKRICKPNITKTTTQKGGRDPTVSGGRLWELCLGDEECVGIGGKAAKRQARERAVG